MKTRRLALALSLTALVGASHAATPEETSFSELHGQEPAPRVLPGWVLEQVPCSFGFSSSVHLRAGYLPEAEGVEFRGNVLYLEGFADSMANHDRFLGALSAAGFRVIAFDYPGQGGSEGSMNQTRIPRIAEWGKQIRERFARTDGPATRNVIGWSTGGLAAHMMAAEGEADRVVELAPGIHIRPIVGDFGKVTLETLTSHPAKGLPDFHVEAPSPLRPALLPGFALSITKNSLKSQTREIDPSVRGLVLLSGPGDRYVRGAATKKTLARKAHHFEVVEFPEALHELHEEVEPIASEVQAKVLEFLTAE